MNHRLVWHILGNLFLFSAVSMLLPLGVSLIYKEPDLMAWIYSILVTATAGGLIRFFTSREGELHHREGFAVVSLSWILLPLFGSLPFLFAGVFDSPIDAYFECMSGYTTTGATVMTDIESQHHGILFWRSLIQWIGGMGFIVLSIAILPLLGVGGMQLFKAEVPGPVKDRLTPRITSTAKILWIFYLSLSLAEFLLLMVGGMDWFDSICHTFCTMATGGFSTKNASVGAYHSAFIELVIIIFMFSAGVNFSIYYKLSKGGWRDVLKDEEFKFYCAVILIMTVLIGFVIYPDEAASPGEALRDSAFQTVSIITTTGFGTKDFDQWPPFGRFALLALMFFGGCAGSTGGGIKQVRILILFKHAYRELKRLIYPGRVLSIKISGKAIPNEVATNVMGFFLLYMIVFLISTLIISFLGVDLLTSLSAVAACIGNIGPGLAQVGPTLTFAPLHGLSKIILSFCMVVGRLELYTVLLLFLPGLWKK